MNVEVFPSGPFDTNAYLAICKQTKQTAIIDPAPGSFSAICSYITDHQLLPQKICLTHSHWDHIADVSKFKQHYAIPVYIHAADTPNLKQPGADLLPCWIPIQGVEADGVLSEGEKVAIGKCDFQVIETPGHTPGGICLYCPKEHILFSGDTLFKDTIGNLSFPTACPDLMWGSLAKLAKLPAETRVYPGHGPATTIGEETWLPRAKQIFGNSY